MDETIAYMSLRTLAKQLAEHLDESQRLCASVQQIVRAELKKQTDLLDKIPNK